MEARSGPHDLKQRRQSGGFHSFKVYRDTQKKPSLNWDCTEVLSMTPIAQIWNRLFCFSGPNMCFSTNRKHSAIYVFCDTRSGWNFIEGDNPRSGSGQRTSSLMQLHKMAKDVPSDRNIQIFWVQNTRYEYTSRIFSAILSCCWWFTYVSENTSWIRVSEQEIYCTHDVIC